MKKKGKPVSEFQSSEWMQNLAFMVDVTQHLNNLNKVLQGRKRLVTQYYDTIRAFKLKLPLWETQLSGDDTAHFPCLKSVRATGMNSDLNQYKDKITGLLCEFKQRFQIFGQLETAFKVFCSPFTVNPSDLPIVLQLEIIDLQCDSDLKTKFALASLNTFYQYLFPGYPKRHPFLQKFCACLGQHIFVNKCSLWWTSTKQSCAHGLHMLT